MVSKDLIQQEELIEIQKDDKNRSKRRLILLLLFFLLMFFLYTLASLGDFGFLNQGPRIDIDPKYWDREASVDVIRDATSRSGIKNYQYCITNEKNTKDCEWKDLADKKLNLYQSGKYYIYYRAVSNSGTYSSPSNRVTALIDNINPVINNLNIYEITDRKISINLDVFDSLSGIDSITYQINTQEPVITTDSSFTFDNLKPDTKYYITIVVYDKVANKTTLTIPITTMEEGFDLRNQCFDDDVVVPKITIEPDNEWWSTYKLVTVDFGDNNCKHEVSLDLGKTWQEYTGPILYTYDGYITARSTNETTGKSVESTDDPRVKYIDPTVPKIGLDDVPSSFEYGTYNELPSNVEFGRSEGTYECLVDGVKEGGTQLLKVGSHTIKCFAYGNNGLTTTVEKDIEVLYRTGQTISWDGWITLTLDYPPESINRRWKLFDNNTVISPDMTQYYWQDYTGPITIRLDDLEKIRIAYDINGETVIANYGRTDLIVDIIPDKGALYHDETTDVRINYSGQCQEKIYRINNGNWENYTGKFNVGPNTVIEGKCIYTKDVVDSTGNTTEQVNTGYSALYIPKVNYYTPDGSTGVNDQQLDLEIVAEDNPVVHNHTTKITINSSSQFNFVQYKILSRANPSDTYEVGSLQDYTEPFEVYDDTIIYAYGYILVNGEYKTISKSLYVGTVPDPLNPDSTYVPMFNLLPLKIEVDDNPVEYGFTTKARLIYDSDITDRIQYRVNGGNWRDYTGEFTVSPGDTIEARAESNSDDYYSSYDMVVIKGFTATYVDVLGPPEIVFEVQDDKSVKVTIIPQYGASYICYEVSNYYGEQDDSSYGTCLFANEYVSPFYIQQGQYVSAQYIRQTDGRTSRYTIRMAPILTYPPGTTEVHQQPSVWIVADPLNSEVYNVDKVLITIPSWYADKVQYSLDGIHYYNYTGPFYVTENCKIWAYAENQYGRAYTTYSVTNIGNTPPTTQPIPSPNISINYYPTNAHLIPTIESVDITITYDDDATEKYYRIGANGEWQEYDGPFVVSENTVIYAYEKGPSGVADTSLAITFFTKGFMEPWIVSDPDNSIVSTIDTITILYDDSAVTKYYQIDNGAMIEYTGPFDVTKNCTITAVETDANGVLAYSTYYVTNIASGGGTSVTVDDEIYLIKLHYPPASFNQEYKNDDEGVWKPYTGDIAIMSTQKFVSLYDPVENTLIYKGRDYIDDYYIFDGDITRFNGHFSLRYDTVKSNSPAIIPDSTEYYVAKVGIEITYDPALVTQEYRLQYGDGAMTSWMPYTGKFYLTENNVTVYARGKDSNSTYSTVAKKLIDNIAIEGRVLVTRDYQALTAYLVDFNPNRDIDRYEFSLDGVDWIESSENSFTFDGLDLNTSYTLFVKAIDVDGRVYNFKAYGRTKNFTKPTFTASPRSEDWSQSRTITINYHDEYYDDITIDKYYTLDGGTTWIPYEGPFTITANETIVAMAVQTGNPTAFILSDKYVEKMIDTTAPIITSVNIKEESARFTIDAAAIDNESGVKYYYYSIDGVNYFKTPSTQYSYTNLKKNTKYTIYVKAENYAGVISAPTIVQPQTKDIDRPVFKYLESLDDQQNVIISDWGWEKLVHIRVPYLDQDTIVSYSLDNGTTWNDIQLTKVTLNVPAVPDPEYIRETDSDGNYTGNLLIYSPDGYTKVEVGTTQYNDLDGHTWTVVNDGSGVATFTYDGPGTNNSVTRTYGDFDVTLNKENQSVFVKVKSGTQNEVIHSFTTHLIDRTEPTLNYDNLPRVLEMGDDSYTLFNTWWVNNNKSGGDYSCTVNGDPVDKNSTTGVLRTGYQKIVCTVRTGAGHSVPFEHTLPVYSSLKIDAESIVQGIRDAQGIPGNALDGGDYTLVIPGPDGTIHNYPIELYNYGTTTISSNTTFCDNVPDFKYCVIRYNGDLTINSGVTISTPSRKLGFVIYVEGKLTNNGTITGTGMGAQYEAEDVLLWKNDDTYYEYIPQLSSGLPGNGQIRGGSAGTSNGTAGAAGFFRETGSGGGGSSRGTSSGYTKGGAGSYGTAFGGGAGGGSSVTSAASGTYSQSNILTGGNASNNGTGGAGVLTWINNSYTAGGGAGAIGGRNTHYNNSSTVVGVNTTDSKSGGSIIIYAHDYQNNGIVASQGGQPYTYGTGATGGSAGGGSIDIFYDNLINRGTTNVSGGAAAGSPAGGAGGAGTVTYSKILGDYDLLGTKNNPYQITNASDLIAITQHNNDYRDAYYELANDIDMGGQSIDISSTGFAFSGHFDGKGHKISNFKSTSGLFTSVYRGQIHDLTLDNATVSGTNNVGILAGNVTGKTDIWNINITNSKLTGSSNVGGLIGNVNISDDTNIVNINIDANITGTTNTGGAIGNFVNSINKTIKLDNIVVGTTNFKPQSLITTPVGSSPNAGMVVNGGSYTGGVIGKMTNSGRGTSTLTYASFDGKVNATGQYTGGLVGYVEESDKDGHITFDMNYTNANVTSTSTYTGGYIGYISVSNADAVRMSIDRSYSAGSVTGTEYIGGFIGYSNKVNINNTYTVASVTGSNNIGGYIGSASSTDIDQSYTTGLITHSGTTNYGAFAGYATNSSVVDSYYSTETNKVQRSSLGINQRIQHLLKQSRYNNYSFGSIWGIDEDTTTAYLLGLPIPDMAYESNIPHVVLEGDGDQTNPYIIHNKQEFEEIANELTAYYVQANDIDLNNTALNVKTETKAPFSGYYSGQGYKLNNIVNTSTNDKSGIFDYADSAIVENLEINISQTGAANTGALFGYAKNSIEVRDVTINGTVTGTTNTGGLIGQYENNNNLAVLYEPEAVIQNVTINANVTGTNNAGGLIGYLLMSQDKNSSNQEVINQGDISISNVTVSSNHTITGNYYVGGIVGYIYDISDGDVTIDAATNEASVVNNTLWTTSQNVATGGIVGYVQNVSTGDILIENSKNKGNINGQSNVGGIVGYLRTQNTGFGHIYRSYSIGNITGNTTTNTQHNVGGIVGNVWNGSRYINEIRECYSTGDVSGYDNVGGLIGGSITSAQSNISNYIGSMYVEVHDSFTTSKVNGKTNVGSLMGYQNYAKVFEVYAIGENLSTDTNSHALVPVYKNSSNEYAYYSSQTIGLVRSQYGTNLKIWKLEHQRFVTGFDFDNIWTVDEGESTPYLQHVDKPDAVNDININYNKMNGEGTEENPYEIWDIEDFDDIRNEVTAVYKFMDDVDGNDAPLVPLTLSHLGEYKTTSFTATSYPETIAFSDAETVVFRGKIYGNNKTLKNITLPDTGSFGGLFPVCNNIYVDNLTLDNINITGAHNTGLICGYNYGSMYLDNVDNNNSKVTTTGNSYSVGGLVGYHYTSSDSNTITLTNNDSYNLKINGYQNVGGVVGYIRNNFNADINIKKNDINLDMTPTNVSGGLLGRTELLNGNFYADENRTSGIINGSDTYIGGQFGYIYSSTAQGQVFIENSVNEAPVKGNRIGGIAGELYNASTANFVVNKVTNKATVTKYSNSNYYGGIIGDLWNNSIGVVNLNELVNTGVVTGYDYTGGIVGYSYNVSTGDIRYDYVGDTANITGNNYVGGLVGYNYNKVANAGQSINLGYATGDVSGTTYIGGIIGRAYGLNTNNISVTKAYSSGNVIGGTASGNYVGGLIGAIDYGKIENAYSLGSLTGNAGLTGYSNRTTITNTYAVNPMNTSALGSLTGGISNTTTTDSYYVSEISKVIRATTGKNLKMWQAVKSEYYNNWNFEDIWDQDENETPYLRGLPKAAKAFDSTEIIDLDGDGSENDPYLIHNLNELDYIRYELDAHYKIVNDIDISTLSTIGESGICFTGYLDGDNHILSNSSTTPGIFYCTRNAGIDNLTVKDFSYNNVSNVGALIGYVYDDLTLNNINFTGNFTSTGSAVSKTNIGAITSYAENANIVAKNITYTGNIDYSTGTSSNIGTLIGYIKNTTLDVDGLTINSTVTTRQGVAVGGVVGLANTNSKIKINNLDYDGNITSADGNKVGGVVGNADSCEISLTNSTHDGDITSTKNIGGIAGYVSGDINVEKYTHNGNVTGTGTNVAGLAGTLNRNIDSLYGNNIKDVTFEGDITGTTYVSGLYGYLNDSVAGAINVTNLVIDSDITGTSYVSGLFGRTINSGLGNIEVHDSSIVTPITATGDYIGTVFGHLETSNASQIMIDNNLFRFFNLSTNGSYIGSLMGYAKLGGNGVLKIDNVKNMDVATEVNGETTYGQVMKSNVSGASYVGGLVGYLGNTSTGYIYISNIGVDANIAGSGDYVGGLIGKSEGTSTGGTLINNIYHIGNTTGNNYVGGFIGQMIQNGKGTNHIDFGYNSGDVLANNSYAGGLIGTMKGVEQSYTAITRCYNDGSVKANTYAAGIAATMERAIITNAFNIAGIEAEDYLAGIAVNAAYSTIKDVYTTGRVYSLGRNIGGFVASSTLSVAQDSYFSADTTLVNQTALGINMAFEYLLTKDPAYREWDWEEIWDIDYEETTAYLRGLPKPSGINRGYNDYSIMSGSGTEEDPYVIMNQYDLSRINVDNDAYYILGADIPIYETFIIYPQSNNGNIFTGTLDGKGHSINNLVIDTHLDNLGLFGIVEDATIKNIDFINPVYKNHMSTAENVGAVTGVARGNTVIENVTVSGANYDTLGSNIGGIVGKIESGNVTIKDSEVINNSINGTNNIGGVAGYIDNTESGTITISNIKSDTDVTSTGSNTGGIVGKITNQGSGNVKVNKSYVLGETTSEGDYVGGLIGYINNTGSGNTKIEINYTHSDVNGRSYVGGLIGGAVNTIIDNNFTLGSVSGDTIAGLVSDSRNNNIDHSYTFSKIHGYNDITKIGAVVSQDVLGTYNNTYYSSDKSIVNNNPSVGTDIPNADFVKQSSFNDYDFTNIWKIDEGETTPYFKDLVKPDFDEYYIKADYTHTVEHWYDFFTDESVSSTGYYRVLVQNQAGTELHYINLNVYNGDQTWSDDVVLGNKFDVATSAKEAQNSVGFKVNGNLTIESTATVTAYASQDGYGGPKGMLSYVSGTITNNGVVSMTKRGAKAQGQNVYLYRMPNGFIETVPAVGEKGGAGVVNTTYSTSEQYYPGITPAWATKRATGGGGSGGLQSYKTYGVTSGRGGNGTSYSGGPGGGGVNFHVESGTYVGNAGSDIGGAGGAAYSNRGNSSWVTRQAGGGAGNPGGNGSTQGNGNDSSMKGDNGTGGLYVLFCNTLINNNTFEADGALGAGNAPAAGGSSGGGSVNILCEHVTDNGDFRAHGGASVLSSAAGGAGGNGYADYEEIDPLAAPRVDVPIITTDTTNWSFTKTITIDYNSGWDRQYSLDNGETWNTYTEPFVIDQSWTTVIARTVAHGVVLESASYLVTMIDEFVPIVELDIPDSYDPLFDNTDISIPTYDEFNEAKSSGSTTCYYDNSSNVITNINQVPTGRHTIICDAVAGSGKTTTIEKVIKILAANCDDRKGEVYNYSYVQSSQEFDPLCLGLYKFEVWGAKGGNDGYAGGNGGYSQGTREIVTDVVMDNYYVLTGGAGGNGGCGRYGGFNGGGNDGPHCSSGAGGGLTQITVNTDRGILKNYENYKNEVLIVAGGGGGGGLSGSGGSGGGTTGGDGTGRGGTQTAGGAGNGSGSFGQGAHKASGDGGGGGGGWYGGGGATSDTGGGGGSGYVNPNYLINTSMTNGTNSGNGYAKVTYLGYYATEPIITVDDPDNWTGSKEVTITYDDYRVEKYHLDTEYSLDNGISWLTYTGPITINEAVTVVARHAHRNYTISSSSFKVTKIVGSKPEIYLDIEDHYFFEVDHVDLPSRYNFNHEDNIGTIKCYYDDNDTDNVITNIDEIPEGLHSIECKIRNGYGRESTARKDNIAITTYYFSSASETPITYSYTGKVQTFSPKYPGTYMIEVWGAQGGDRSGNGAYAKGTIDLRDTKTLYVYVGGRGATGCLSATGGGWNGGGSPSGSGCSASGGGATDIRLLKASDTETTWNEINSLRSRIIVAAGGGGSEGATAQGGGTINGTGNNAGNYATQTSGSAFGYCPTPGYDASAGGGGYWGGLNPTGDGAPGGGGSSYISGHLGTVAVASVNSTSPRNGSNDSPCTNSSALNDIKCSYHYSGYIFKDTQMISGNSSMPNTAGTGNMTGNAGNGYAKFTRLGVSVPIITVDSAQYAFEKTVSISYDDDERFTKEYSLDLGETWNTYTGSFELTRNGTVIARLAYKGNTVTSYSMTVTNIVQDCDEYAEKSIELRFKGKTDDLTLLCTGVYKVEAWGASGGNGKYSYDNIEHGGFGAYTSGMIEFNAKDKLYINVGGRGKDASSSTQYTTITGGYNGGGNGVSGGSDDQAASGGGASDIRLTSGAWNNGASLASRIMVAAGGGGGHSYAASNNDARTLFPGINGQALSYTGNIGIWNGSSRQSTVNQITGYAFGIGASYSSLTGTHGAGGGGGGYYGGTTSTTGYGGPGSGGSSYISGHVGSVAITSESSTTPKTVDGVICPNGTTNVLCSIHYSNKYFVDTQMIAGNNTMPTHDGTSTMTGNDGNGFVKIKYIGDITKISQLPEFDVSEDPSDNSRKLVTITYDSYDKEYSLDLGETWNTYTEPLSIYGNATIIARTTYHGKLLKSASFTITSYQFDYDEMMGKKYEFQYTGKGQEFIAPKTGSYRIELWGASGKYTNNVANPGLGGYTSGDINLRENDKLYVYVGESGNITSSNYNSNSFNGGGYTHNTDQRYGRGGGATDVRLTVSNLSNWDNFDSLKSRIMVAGGGGSGHDTPNSHGGAAGGLISYKGNGTAGGGAPATQTSGYAFGYGGPGLSSQAFSGSGGGYFGGKSSTTSPCDVSYGGSSYISGHNGSIALQSSATSSSLTFKDNSEHYSGKVFTNTKMVDGNGFNWTTVADELPTGMPNTSGTDVEYGHLGNGFAKITYLGTPKYDADIPEIHISDQLTRNYRTVDITYDSDFDHEYSLDKGRTWNTYSGPFRVYENLTIIARTLVDGIVINSSSFTTTKFASTCDDLIGSTYNYDYINTEDSFVASCAGTYKLEVWGAQGGSFNETYHGGYGGYSVGELNLNDGQTLYINVGGQGSIPTSSTCSLPGGYNGGGSAASCEGYSLSSVKAGSGGGATSIAFTSGLLSNLDVNNILMVAGGGGGSDYSHFANDNNYHSSGGSGGGFKGASSTGTSYSNGGTRHTVVNGGTQNLQTGTKYEGENGFAANLGRFGQGANATRATEAGGGGGYYGGNAGKNFAGGGGSGYIGNLLLSNKHMTCYNCDTDLESDNTRTETNDCHNATASTDCAKEGNGYARITYIYNPNPSTIDASQVTYSSEYTECTDVDCALNELYAMSNS